MNPIETFDVNGKTVEIFLDEYATTPREDDNLGTMVCLHRRYSLGDVQEMEIDDARKLEQSDDVISLPLYMFDHSGLTLSTSDRMFRACDPQGWDWSKLGFIYVEKSKVRAEYGVRAVTKKVREAVLKELQAEVELYDQFLRGEVYGFAVLDEDGEAVESVFGFYDLDEVRSEARSAAASTKEG